MPMPSRLITEQLVPRTEGDEPSTEGVNEPRTEGERGDDDDKTVRTSNCKTRAGSTTTRRAKSIASVARCRSALPLPVERIRKLAGSSSANRARNEQPSTEGATRVRTEGAGSSETNTTVPASNCNNKVHKKATSGATSVAKIRTVNGERIGSKRGTAKGMSKKRLTKLLEEQIAQDKKQIKMAQEALKQSIPVSKPIPITQEDEPIEMPQQQEQPVIPEQQEIQEPPIQQLRRSKRLEEVEQPIYYQRPPNVANIRKEALYHVMEKVLFDSSEASIPDHLINNKMNISPAIDLEALQQSNLNVGSEVDLDKLCNGVVHPITKETITKYKKLEDPMLRDDWIEAMCKELGRLAQGYNETAGTDTIRFLTHEEIRCIPADRTVTYARIVVDYVSTAEGR